MPRRGRGVGAGGKVNLRGFAHLFKELPSAGRLKLESAFVEAEDLVDFHSLSVPGKIIKRKLTGILESPVLSVTNSILGGTVTWTKISDPKIAIYDVQVDDINVFPSPTKYEIRENFFSLDRITSPKFIRVRGVRLDGQAGNWSNTVTMRPSSSAPLAHTFNFYQRYTGAEPKISFSTEYSGGPDPDFYTLFETSFYADRTVGGMMIWGYACNRLKTTRNSDIRPWDRVRFSINGITRMEGHFPLWTDSSNDDQTVGVYQTGEFYLEPTNFYNRGGYTASFGPFSIDHPSDERGDGYKDPRRGSSADIGQLFYWNKTENVKRPSRWDRGSLASADGTTSNLKSSSLFGDETYIQDIPGGSSSNYLKVQDFNLKVPLNKRITGIKLAIKRRQSFAPESTLLPDWADGAEQIKQGVLNRPIQGAYAFDSVSGKGLIDGMTIGDVVEDPDQGKYLLYPETDRFGRGGALHIGHEDFPAGPASPPPYNSGRFGLGQTFTISTWVKLFALGTGSPGGSDTLFSMITRGDDGDGELLNVFRMFNNDVLNPDQFQVQMVTNDIGGFVRFNYFTLLASTGVWYNIVVVNDGSKFILYRNGVFVDKDSQTGGFFTRKWTNGPNTWCSIGSEFVDQSIQTLSSGWTSGPGLSVNGGMGQVAIWNRALSASEAGVISASKMTGDLRNTIPDGLVHYYLFFPGDPDIRDYEVRLIDSEGTVKTDIDNKAILTETWPGLVTFFYADTSGSNQEATAKSFPHDNLVGVGYQEYGGTRDLWGNETDNIFYDLTISPSAIANPNWGFAIRIKNQDGNFAGSGSIDHVKAQVFWDAPMHPEVKRIDLKVEAETASHFYIVREVFGGILNAIEVGEKI